MTTLRPAQPATPAFGVKQALLDALFCLLLPVLLLREHLPGTDLSFSALVGPLPAYLTASLIPITYILLSTLRSRQVNAVTWMAAGSAMLSGMLAFLPVSGLAFAIKDSSGSLLLLGVTTGSLLLRRPFSAALLRLALLPDTPERGAQLEALLSSPVMRSATVNTTRVLQVKALLVVTVNILVKSAFVTAPFGTVEFNTQLASATSVMIPVAWLASSVGYGTTTWLLSSALQRQLNRRVRPWGPAFWDAVDSVSALQREVIEGRDA